MSIPLMTNRDDFNNEDQVRSYLANQLVLGRLSVVLGAGISYHFGLPLWNKLVQRLYEGTPNSMPTGDHSNEDLVSYFLRTYFNSY